MLIALPHPQLLELEGPDAANFAHAQFSSDVQALAPGHWQWSAWLSPQGRVRYFFALLRATPERLVLLLRGGEAVRLCEELSRFVFRSRVKLRVRTDLRMFGCDDAAVVAHCGSRPEGDRLATSADGMAFELPGAGRWLLLSSSASTADVDAASLSAWQLADVRAGLPQLSPQLSDRLLPQWLGLERLRAISVTKGCYPGQEIMARLHFKGGNKRGLYRIEFVCDVLPAAETGLTSEDAEAGAVITAAWASRPRAEALATLTDSAAGTRVLAASGALRDIQVISRFD